MSPLIWWLNYQQVWSVFLAKLGSLWCQTSSQGWHIRELSHCAGGGLPRKKETRVHAGFTLLKLAVVSPFNNKKRRCAVGRDQSWLQQLKNLQCRLPSVFTVEERLLPAVLCCSKVTAWRWLSGEHGWLVWSFSWLCLVGVSRGWVPGWPKSERGRQMGSCGSQDPAAQSTKPHSARQKWETSCLPSKVSVRLPMAFSKIFGVWLIM